MNSQQMINSIYNPRKKPREPFVFPKISKAEATPPENKVFVRGAGRKYNQQNIFKIEDEKKQKVKMHIEEQRLKELRQRESEQMQLKISAMNRRHQEQMRQLEEQQRNVNAQIQQYKKNQYQVKYSLWELKNQIMNLNAIYLEQQTQYQRLYQEVGYMEEGEEGEGEEGENYQEMEEENEGLEEYNNRQEEFIEADEQEANEEENNLSHPESVQLQDPYQVNQLNLQNPSPLM